MAQNFKDALLEGTEQTEPTTPSRARGPRKPETPAETAAPVESAAPATEEVTTNKVAVFTTNPDKEYLAIGLKNYSTVIAGKPVVVEAGKPWKGTKYQYDALKRAKLIQ